MVLLSSPETSNMLSRSSSAVSRRGGKCQRRLFSGSSCCGAHDEAVHFLHAPGMLDEIAREPIKLFGINRLLAHFPEIVGSGDEALAEVPLPDPVDHDASSERIFGAGNPSGEGEAAS